MAETILGSPLLLATLGSLAAGLMTAVGAAPVLAWRKPGEAGRDAMLGFAAGVMLSAAFFSLIVPAIEAAEGRWGPGLGPPAVAALGILLGMGAVALLNEWLPHEHFDSGPEGPQARTRRRIWLFVAAIAIHNLPEGLAVGVAFAAGGLEGGLPLAIGIGLQNAPEGLAVAVALRGVGYRRRDAFGVAALTGLIEPVGGLAGALVLAASAALLPWALAFAAGAMLYVISHEIIPETHAGGHQRRATAGLGLGLVAMMVLDVWLA
ncbi:ZIP family metal transporter [Rubellimicrobium sp. CFH 75288]|uniref:ZIP family metal transporter n=1 Tax=Rubellimicrobium sp. CFH 75288 TaxID=2697034 RepID=UPI001412FE02|nr:ZIP family metal transporter [Rubellimicrobium sp. CFH 75288]NAZ37982.1 ZIP family metal transporter [Rubellimicrobium sp. CFH 75288]